MDKETVIVNALWRARSFILEATHDDERYRREVLNEVNAILSSLDPHYATVVAEENIPLFQS